VPCSTEANPKLFSDYVVALLSHNQSDDEIKAMCLQQLELFTKDGARCLRVAPSLCCCSPPAVTPCCGAGA
jgi:hypothetical protein